MKGVERFDLRDWLHEQSTRRARTSRALRLQTEIPGHGPGVLLIICGEMLGNAVFGIPAKSGEGSFVSSPAVKIVSPSHAALPGGGGFSAPQRLA